ncbi:hypothetical protein [Rossellomorea aquimaris]|uniref:hypothetical protein n=1 Tax=Rossellomorea aquimaris TaxID=189382 RepID=UPI0007D042FC|nr:hypothetical protein [Rossellomorea aquimaris]
MRSKFNNILLGLVLFAIILYVYPIGKLAFTDTQVTKSLLVEEYYVKISSDDYDFDVFRDYMESRGWKENGDNRMGGLYVFEMNGERKEIINTQIKTIFVNGKLNF